MSQSPLPQAPAPKPGYKTTELWVSLVAQLIAILQVYGVLTDVEGEAWLKLAAALIAVIPAAVYTWSRTKVKTLGLG